MQPYETRLDELAGLIIDAGDSCNDVAIRRYRAQAGELADEIEEAYHLHAASPDAQGVLAAPMKELGRLAHLARALAI